MPTDAELRTLFHEVPAPGAEVDTGAVIRRSRRRRLPQQLGLGSVLTLAIAGIAVAGFTGLNRLSAPMTAADSVTAADAPAGEQVPESGGERAPYSTGAESVAGQRASCVLAPSPGANAATDFTANAGFAETVRSGLPLAGTITLTNTGDEPTSGTVVDAMIALSRDGAQGWHRDESAIGTRVALAAGESMTLGFSFEAVGCANGADAAPLEPGQYRLTPAILVDTPDGDLHLVRGQASALTVR